MEVNIHKNNIDWWLTRYQNGELTLDEMNAVDEFLLNHDSILDSLIDNEIVAQKTSEPFQEKNSLLKIIIPTEHITEDNYNDYFADAIDGNTDIQDEVSNFIALNPVLEKEWKLFQHTKLKPELITYPYIKDLYKSTISWKSIIYSSVAATILLLIGLRFIVPSFTNENSIARILTNGKIKSIIIASNFRIQYNSTKLVSTNNDMKNSIPTSENSSNKNIVEKKDIYIPNTGIKKPSKIHFDYSDAPELAYFDIEDMHLSYDNDLAESQSKKLHFEDVVNGTMKFIAGKENEDKWNLKVDRSKTGKIKDFQFSSPIVNVNRH